MKKTLFLVEFKKAFVPFALVVLAILGGILGIERGMIHYKILPPDAGDVVDACLIGVYLGLAFPFGARAFARDFKETQFLFIHSLPLSRGWTWAMLVSANFSAALAALLIAATLHPSVFVVLLQAADRLGYATLPAGYILLFSSAACISLIFRRVVLVYIVGGTFVLAMTGEAFLLHLYSRSDPRHIVSEIPLPAPGPTDVPFAIAALSALVLLFLFFSFHFFVGGEFNLFKVQTRNFLSLLASALVLLVALATSLHLGAFTFFDSWNLQYYGWWERVPVSADGKYLCVVERREKHPQFCRVNIVNIQTGRLERRSNQKGLRLAQWSARGHTLGLEFTDDSPVSRLSYLLPPSDSVLAFSPEAGALGVKSFSGFRIAETAPMNDDRTLLVLRKGDSARVVAVNRDADDAKVMCEGRLDGWFWMQPAGADVLVYFHNRGIQSRLWRVRSEAEEIHWAVTPKPEGDPRKWVVYGTAYNSAGAAARALAKLYPFTPSLNESMKKWDSGAYVVNANGYGPIVYIDDSTPILYILVKKEARQGKLFAYDSQHKFWKPLAESVPLTWAGSQELPKVYEILSRPNAVDWDSPHGVAAYIVETGEGYTAVLYDARLDKTIELAKFRKVSQANWRVDIRNFGSTKGILILFIDNRSPTSGSAAFLYTPQSGQPRAMDIGNLGDRVLSWMGDDGSRVTVEYSPDRDQVRRILYVEADRRERQLWPIERR